MRYVVNFGEIRRAQLAKSSLLTSALVPLGSFKVCSGAKERGVRKATGRYCNLGSCVCRERPALGQNTQMMKLERFMTIVFDL